MLYLLTQGFNEGRWMIGQVQNNGVGKPGETH